MLKTKLQKGFTIVELLIVIVVIGILAALVLNTFSGVQARARDSQRQTDVRSLATALEVYYNAQGVYPVRVTTNAATGAFDPALLQGVDAESMKPPTGTAAGLFATRLMGVAAAPNLTTKPVCAAGWAAPCPVGAEAYVYWSKTTAGADCAVATGCPKFTMYYFSEANIGVITKDSLN